VLAMIVRRPETDRREMLAEGQLDLAEGLVGTVGEAGAVPRRPTAQPTPRRSSP